MQVFDDDQQWLLASLEFELIEQCREGLAALLCGAEVKRRIAISDRNGQKRGDQRYRQGARRRVRAEARRRVRAEQCLELVEALLGCVLVLYPGGPADKRRERKERAAAVVGRALIAKPGMGFVRDVFGNHRGQPRLANARLANDQNDLPLALPRQFFAAEQKFDFPLPTHEVREVTGAGVKAAFRVGLADHRPGSDRVVVALEGLRPEIAELEQLSDQPPCGGCDHQRAGFRQALDSIGEIRRIADDGAFLRHAGANQVAHDHRAGRYPHPGRQRFAVWRPQLTDRGKHLEPGAHRAFGVVLVRARVAEINQYAIAQEAREKAIVGRHDGRAGLLVGADDLMHFLRIEASGERRGADEVAEHDRQLAAFGIRHRWNRDDGDATVRAVQRPRFDRGLALHAGKRGRRAARRAVFGARDQAGPAASALRHTTHGTRPRFDRRAGRPVRRTGPFLCRFSISPDHAPLGETPGDTISAKRIYGWR